MKNEMTKEVKHTLKAVDNVLSAIKKSIPETFTPYQVKAIFDLYISMYE